MRRFYRVSNSTFLEIDFVETINEWQAYLIDVEVHKTIATIVDTVKVNVIANIVKDNWFTSNIKNFAIFIEDILKY